MYVVLDDDNTSPIFYDTEYVSIFFLVFIYLVLIKINEKYPRPSISEKKGATVMISVAPQSSGTWKVS